MANKNIVKKKYESLNQSKHIRFGNSFLDEYLLDQEAIDIPINALRIIFKVANDLRNSNFTDPKNLQKLEHKNNSVRQLSLFDETFKNEHNTNAFFRFKRSVISNSKNIKVLEKSLEWLEEFKKGWYTSLNSKGEKIKSYGGLIKEPSYSKGYISFLISQYWLEKLVYMPNYNTYLRNIVDNTTNNKIVIFYIWLGKIKKDGTIIKYATLNNKYKLNYKSANDLCKLFLRPIKTFLDIHGEISFNYSHSKESISISPYYNTVIKNTQNSPVITDLEIKQKLHYFRRKYNLSEEDIKRLYLLKSDMQLIFKAYKLFIKTIRQKKHTIKDYQQEKFLRALQNCIIACYKETKHYLYAPSGHPKVYIEK